MEIRRGDLVKVDGVEFHISKSRDGIISYWAADVERSYTDTFDQFVDRAEQGGGIRILPGEGKYESREEEDDREPYFEVA